MKMSLELNFITQNIRPMLRISSRIFKNSNSLTEPISIRSLRYNRHLINFHHIRCRLRVQRIHIDTLALLQTDHHDLAGFCDQAALVIVVEERVEPGAVDEDVSAVEEAEAESFVACRLVAFVECGVGVCCLWLEGGERVGIVLHVSV